MATVKNKGRSKNSSGGGGTLRVYVAKAKAGSGRENSIVDLTARIEQEINSEVKDVNGSTKPPYDPSLLYDRFESSAWLRPNVDSYVTNIESFGHHYIPGIDLTSSDSDVRIADAIYYERVILAERNAEPTSTVSEPTEEEVKARRENLRRTARLEYAKLRAFFSFVCPPPLTFVGLRRKIRQDVEVTGNGYIEVTRNSLGEIARFHYVSPIPMRLMPNLESVKVEESVRVTDITWMKIGDRREFRTYLKIAETGIKPIYFKEFGDPRILSRFSGIYYTSVEELIASEDDDAVSATEIIHFKIATPKSIYGIPRWIGNLPAALGSRELDLVNLDYFKNNVVPPLALLVSGGRFGSGVAARIEEYIDETIKGKKGVHRILVLEAEGQKTKGEPGPRTVPKVQFVPLRDVQLQDALFQEYDKRNEEKIAKSFRLPRILRGDDSAINRATATISLKFADEQIFEPERQEFDEFMNRVILPELGITFWLFRSNAPIVRDPEVLSEMLERLVKVGVLLPSEAREIATDIFNTSFVEISEEWSNKPLPIILAQLKQGLGDDIYEPRNKLRSAQEGQEQGRGQGLGKEQDEAKKLIQTQTRGAVLSLRPAGSPIKNIGSDNEE